jgi:hypothetical protein
MIMYHTEPIKYVNIWNRGKSRFCHWQANWTKWVESLKTKQLSNITHCSYVKRLQLSIPTYKRHNKCVKCKMLWDRRSKRTVHPVQINRFINFETKWFQEMNRLISTAKTFKARACSVPWVGPVRWFDVWYKKYFYIHTFVFGKWCNSKCRFFLVRKAWIHGKPLRVAVTQSYRQLFNGKFMFIIHFCSFYI